MQQRTELEVLLRQSLDDVKAEILRPLGSGCEWTTAGLREKDGSGRQKERKGGSGCHR